MVTLILLGMLTVAPGQAGGAVHVECPKPVHVGDRCTVTFETDVTLAAFVRAGRVEGDPGEMAVLGCGPASKKDHGSKEPGPALSCIVVPLDVGLVSVDALDLELPSLKADTGRPDRVTIPGFTIDVQPLLENDAVKPRPMKGPVRIFVPVYWPLVVMAIVASLLVLVLYLAFARAKRKRTGFGSPADDAVSTLERLIESGIFESDQKRVFNQVALVVREFLDRTAPAGSTARPQGAVQSTRKEIADRLRREGLAGPLCYQTEKVLAVCDKVRFAGARLDAESARKAIEDTIEVVREIFAARKRGTEGRGKAA